MNSDARTNPHNSVSHPSNGAGAPVARPAPADMPLQIEPDTDDERPGYGWQWNQAAADQAHDNELGERQLETERTEVHRLAQRELESRQQPTANDHADGPTQAPLHIESDQVNDMLRWALDSIHEPALAAADWLARDIAPDQPGATALMTDPRASLEQLKKAKSVFKTMRIVGEKSADRRVGARMYAAAIAAALVRHKEFISSQSDDALKRAFQGLLDDKRMPASLRDIAGMALCAMGDKSLMRSATRSPGRRPSPAPQPSQVDDDKPAEAPRSMARPQPRQKRPR